MGILDLLLGVTAVRCLFLDPEDDRVDGPA